MLTLLPAGKCNSLSLHLRRTVLQQRRALRYVTLTALGLVMREKGHLTCGQVGRPSAAGTAGRAAPAPACWPPRAARAAHPRPWPPGPPRPATPRAPAGRPAPARSARHTPAEPYSQRPATRRNRLELSVYTLVIFSRYTSVASSLYRQSRGQLN